MKKAQAILEYAMVVAVAAAALMAMHVYVQRSVQSNLRLIDDRITAKPADSTNLPHLTPTPPPPPPDDGGDGGGDGGGGETHPLPPGEEWVWGNIPTISLSNGGEKVYIVDVDPADVGPDMNIAISILGLTGQTRGTFTWQYPNGDVIEARTDIYSNTGAGVLRLESLPAGRHALTINSTANGSRFAVQIFPQ